MRTFYYVHTGHRIGLDRFHRAVAIVNELQKTIDITLLCSDFRIAGEAKNYGIKRATSVDVVRNIPQIAHHGDKIIFDSAEVNPTLLEDMISYFSTFIRLSDDPLDVQYDKEFVISPYLNGERICNDSVIADKYYTKLPKTIPVALFFGDDDYEKDLEINQKMFSDLNMDLLMGYYHFLGYEKQLLSSFKMIHECEVYDEVIMGTDVLISASPTAVLQNLCSGGHPIFLQRPDYVRDFIPLFTALNIPIIEGYDKDKLMKVISNCLSNSYQNVPKSTEKVTKFILEALNLG